MAAVEADARARAAQAGLAEEDLQDWLTSLQPMRAQLSMVDPLDPLFEDEGTGSAQGDDPFRLICIYSHLATWTKSKTLGVPSFRNLDLDTSFSCAHGQASACMNKLITIVGNPSITVGGGVPVTTRSCQASTILKPFGIRPAVGKANGFAVTTNGPVTAFPFIFFI